MHNIKTLQELTVKCPYGQTGDILWVRETFCEIVKGSGHYYYKADTPSVNIKAFDTTWKPNIHMPKAACRIKLRITSIRIERLHDITEDDALAEGIAYDVMDDNSKACMNYIRKEYDIQYKPKHSFLSLWQSINGLESLTANPWVWVITFERI